MGPSPNTTLTQGRAMTGVSIAELPHDISDNAPSRWPFSRIATGRRALCLRDIVAPQRIREHHVDQETRPHVMLITKNLPFAARQYHPLKTVSASSPAGTDWGPRRDARSIPRPSRSQAFVERSARRRRIFVRSHGECHASTKRCQPPELLTEPPRQRQIDVACINDYIPSWLIG